MIQMLSFDHQEIGFLRFFIGPQITKHFFPVTEARHAILYRFGDMPTLGEDHTTYSEHATSVGLVLV